MSFFISRTKNLFIPTPQTSRKITFFCAIFISLLIFFSIFPLGSADAWWEAVDLVVIFILSGLSIWLNRAKSEERKLLTPLYILAGYSLFQGLITLFLQTGFSDYPAFLPQSFDLTASLWCAFKIFGFALFLDLLVKTFRGEVGFLSWSLILTGNFFAVLGIFRFLVQAKLPVIFESFISPQLTGGVGFGTYFNQNHFAYLMLMVFGLNISLWWSGNLSKGLRFLLAAAALVTWTALVLTGSRGGIISSFAEIAVLILLPVILNREKKSQDRKNISRSKIILAGRRLAILPVIFGLLIVGIVLIGQDRVVVRFEEIPQQIGGITNAATFRRTDVWQAALMIIKESPVFGVGFGGFRVAVSQFIDISGQLVPKQAHNDYLEFAASGGIIAVGLAIWFLFGLFSLFKKKLAEPASAFSAAARIGAVCGIAGLAIHSFFDFGLQITANLWFFAALIFLVVHDDQRPQLESSEKTSPKTDPALAKLLFSILCLTLVCLAAFFGAARYQIAQTQISPERGLIESYWHKIPFDADYYETRSLVLTSLQNPAAATGELKKAISYCPKDYDLWLKLGWLEQMQDHQTEAGNAFRRAIELAPLYAEPRLRFGQFLIKENRRDEGFAELRFALRRNPHYFREIADQMWLEMGEKADDLIKFLTPMNGIEKEQLVSFLFEKGQYPAVIQVICQGEQLPEPRLDSLVIGLLEKRQYHYAKQINERNCGDPNFVSDKLDDGGFDDKKLNDGIGFGWRIPELSDHTQVSYDEKNALKGQSLRFDFNGQEDAPVLLSQIVPVTENNKYRLRYSYKTEEIVTGGVPVLQVILKKPETEILLKETKFSLQEFGWVQTSIEFETTGKSEAVEIRLTRQACPQSLCPIFGSLWLDEFSLQKVK